MKRLLLILILFCLSWTGWSTTTDVLDHGLGRISPQLILSHGLIPLNISTGGFGGLMVWWDY